MAVATNTIATDTYCHQYLLPPVATAIDETDENEDAAITTFSALPLSSWRRKATYPGVGRGRGGGRGGGGGGRKGRRRGWKEKNREGG